MIANGARYPTVLHLIPSLEIGGTERQLLGFIERSEAPGRHHVAVFQEPGALAHRAPNTPIVLGRLGRSVRDVPRDLRVLSAFRRAIRSRHVDLVHTHLHAAELIAGAATPPGLPIVATRRGEAFGHTSNRAFRIAQAMAHRRARMLICNSEYLARRVRADDLSPPRTRVIHNAVDLERFTVAPMPDAGPNVAVVANLHRYKGHERLLRAWRLVRGERTDARLTLVGDGVERPGLERLCERLGIADVVTFAGSVEDPRPFIRDAHVVALTSDNEGFPNALLEAMAMGRPVVATRVGGTPELVRDGRDGFLTSLDPDDIARRLLELLGDAELRGRMAANARARAESFTWDRVVEQTERVYGEVLHPRHI